MSPALLIGLPCFVQPKKAHQFPPALQLGPAQQQGLGQVRLPYEIVVGLTHHKTGECWAAVVGSTLAGFKKSRVRPLEERNVGLL